MKIILTILTFVVFTTACKEKKQTKTEQIQIWYKNIKNEIQSNAELKTDSVLYTKNRRVLIATHYNQNKKIFKEVRSIDTSRLYAIIKFGQNEDFELVTEMSENGIQRTEGVKFKESFYGPWTVCNLNGSIIYNGLRYKQDKFGDWKYYWEDEQLDSIVHMNKMFFIDSILQNENLKTTKLIKK
jgi:hypothetical protein